MTRRGKLKAPLCAAVILSLTLLAYGQTPEWTVIVDGAPVPLSRPAIYNGNDLFVPLLPITRVLGFQVEPLPQSNSLILRRGAGAPIEYDGRNGEIRYGPVVAGQLRNYKLVTISGPMEELLFPVDGLITLLAVDVRLDSSERILYIHSSSDLFNTPSAHRLGVSSIDYAVGITKAGDSEGHYTMLRSDALAGGSPVHSSLLVVGEGSDVQLQQGTVTADVGQYKRLTLGDQSAISGIDSLASSVRGAGFNTIFKTLEASVYGGRTAGTVRATVASPGVANYDSTVFGGALRKRSQDRELSFAANSFDGPERQGTAAGFAFVKTTTRNQLKAQLVAGSFSGLSSRTTTTYEVDPALLLPPGMPITPAVHRVPVHGGALGLSIADTFRPIEPLTITAQLDRYGRNFLTAREDSAFSAQSTQQVSTTFRPLPSLSLYGGVSRRRYLVGDPDGFHGFNYGATGGLPRWRWLQLGYYRVVQNDTGSTSGRLHLSQYSATLMSLLQYSGSFMFSNFHFNGTSSRTINASVGRDFFSYGHLTLHDQLQFNSTHRYGAEWQLAMPRGSLRLGLARLTDLGGTYSGFVPLVGLNSTLPGKQRLTVTYSGERGSHVFSIVIGGPVVDRENLRKDENGRVSVIAEASLEGRIYFDSDGNNRFDPAVDMAMPDITVWLDEQTSVVTDVKGVFRFNKLKSGTHAVRAELAEVPADMVFADSGERRLAVLPFKNNVQNFPIVRTGSLTGKVTFVDYSDPENPVRKPLAEARVIADGEHDTYSDLDGNITLGSLRPGIYQLKVDPETVPEGYVASAVPDEIQVRAGDTLRGVQIHLAIPPRPTITRDLPRQESVSAP
jgi:hypothetical protein